MVFQKGNKFAVGHGYGRPRTLLPTDEEMIKLGEDLVQWASEPTKELRCRYCDWYSPKGILRAQWKEMAEHKVFAPYYEKARALLSKRYIDGSVNPGIAHRYLRLYDPDIRDVEDDVIKIKAAANKQIPTEPFENVIRSIAKALKDPGAISGTSQPEVPLLEDSESVFDQGQEG